MHGHNIIVIGTSAGGVEALLELAKAFPADLDASIFIVLHVGAHAPSVLPKLLSRRGTLPAIHPVDGQQIETRHIYVAPPDQHMILRPGTIHIVRGPKENGHRPAVDPLFRSAAAAYGSRVIGVILTGTLDDGTAGLVAVKQRGGLAVVQDPDDAFYSGMPRSAIENVDVDHIVPLSEIPALLLRLVNDPPATESELADALIETETDIVEMDPDTFHGDDRPGNPSSFGCPDCGGVLWELNDSELIRFRCRTGHAFSVDSLLARQSDTLEEALWSAVRALEERASLSRRMAARMRSRGNTRGAERMDLQCSESERRAVLIRTVLDSNVDGSIPGEKEIRADKTSGSNGV